MTDFIETPTIGEILQTEFLEPLGLSQNALATAIGVPANRINGIVNDARGITADTDLRLTKYFGLSEGYFLRLQDSIELALTKKDISKELAKIVPIDEYRRQNLLAEVA